MKKLFVSLLLQLFILTSYGQQVMHLKSGEKMNGKIEKVVHDSIVFNFKGNKMKVAASEIGAIYFDTALVNKTEKEKDVVTAPQIQEGKISGVVTYFFNNNYGDKPDVGATIYIIDSTKISGVTPEVNPELIIKFNIAYTCRKMAASYKKKDEIPQGIKDNLIKYGVETEEKYKKLEDDATNAFILISMGADNLIKTNLNIIKLTADGNGSFSKTLKPGKYIVLIQSKHRQAMNTMEIHGVIEYKTVKLTAGEEKNLSYNFPVTEL